MKRICDKCGGAGTLPPKTPEVIEVRIKGCSKPGYTYENEIGSVIEVIDNGPIWWKRSVDGDPMESIERKDTEPIPPILPGYRLLNKWGKDEEKIGAGDLVIEVDFPKTGWKPTIHKPGSKQERGGIYITPLKPATPDPSADCLPGYEAVEVFSESPSPLLYVQTPHGGKYLTVLIGHADWSGRYGYKREDGSTKWYDHPRIYKDDDGFFATSPLYGKYNTPVLPNYVEMAKESE